MSFSKNNHHVVEFAKKLAKAWQEQDVEAAQALFSNCKVYLEHPFAVNAAQVPNGIRELWLETLEQSEIVVSTKILTMDSNEAVIRYDARYQSKLGKHETSGIWFAKFKKGQCVEFSQWFNEKN